jgi:hypothetical protein
MREAATATPRTAMATAKIPMAARTTTTTVTTVTGAAEVTAVMTAT